MEEKKEIKTEQKIEEPVKEEVHLADKRNQANNPFRVAYSFIFENKARKTYTLLSFTFLFIALLVLFAILPTLTSITQILKKIEDYRAISFQQKEKINTLYSLRSIAENNTSAGGLNEYINKLDKTFLPDELNTEDIYSDLISRATKANVYISSIKTLSSVPTTSTLSNGLGTYEFLINITSSDAKSIQNFTSSIDLTAERTKIQNLSQSLLNAGRLYTIKKVNISSPIDGTAKIYSASINLLAYFNE